MSLRDELDARRSNGGTCSVKAFVHAQEDPAEWIDLLDDPSIQHSQIHRLMKRHGFGYTTNPVLRHRSGNCACVHAKD